MIDLKERFGDFDEVRWPDLWPEIEARARRTEPTRWVPEPRFSVRRVLPVGAVAVIALVVAIVTTFFPRPQSALAVIQQTQERFAEVPAFRAVVSGSSSAISGEISPGTEAPYRFEQIISYDGEAQWRRDVVEDDASFRGGPGSFTVWDGKQLGEYRADPNEFSLDPEATEERIPRVELNALLRIQQLLQLWFGPEAEGKAETFIEDTCTVQPDEHIAGRLARHLSCPETRNAAGIPETPALEIWVDTEFGLVLRFVTREPFPGVSEVTSIEFNPSAPEGIFQVVPPEGAKVIWEGTGPTPPQFRQVKPDETVVATVPVAAAPYSVAVGRRSVWVATAGRDVPSTIFRLDPASGQTTAAIELSVFGDLVVGEDAVFVYHCRIDPQTNEVEPVRGLVVGEGGSCDPAQLVEPRTAEEERQSQERGNPIRGIVGAASEGAIWAIGIYGSAGSILRLDPATGEVVATIDLGTPEVAGAMAVGQGALWVTAQTGALKSLVYRIDTRTNEIVARIELDLAAGSIAVGEGAVWLTVSPYQGGEGYDPSQGAVMRVDSQTNRVVALVPLEGSGDVAVGGGFVWVTSRNGNTVTRIDPQTNQVVGRPIVVGGEPSSIAVGHGAVWITNFADGTLARIDL